MSAATGSLLEPLQLRCSQWLIATHEFRGDATAIVYREGLLDICRYLRDDSAMAFNLLADLTAVDLLTLGRAQLGEALRTIPAVDPSIVWTDFAPEEPVGPRNLLGQDAPRFEVIYHLVSTTRRHRLRLKVPVDIDDPRLESVTSVWKGADWFEREVWDMFGIVFVNHPNLKRLLMYDGFQGHPLRKDYAVNRRQPLIGPTT